VFSFIKTIFKILTFSFGFVIIATVIAAKSPEFGEITAFNLHVRSAPDRNATSVKVLNKGARVRILKRAEGWLEIYHEGQTGFIRNRERYVHIIAAPSSPEHKPERTVEGIKEESKVITREIKKRKEKVSAITQEEKTLLNGLNEIDLSLNKARKKKSDIRSELAGLEGQIKETTKTSKDLIKSIETTERYVAGRLVALYKLSWLGKIQMLASAENIYDFFQRKTAFEKILAYDDKIRNDLLAKKLLLAKLLERLNAQKEQQLSLEKEYQRQIKFMSKERAKRAQLLTVIRSKRTLELAAIESLRQASTALDEAIKSMVIQKKPFPKHEKPLQKPFTTLKGLLKIPVSGKIVSRFGPYKDTRFNLMGFRSGIHIRADRGEPIRAVSFGSVIFSNWFKGYGNMIIIDHGSNYYTLYAHAEELFKKKGDVVDQEEVIATVGDTGSMSGPRLYFEVRHRGKPLDPMKWVKKG
jgi:septal ring factor EnvC (AmiA/AmiB activator)